MSRSELQTQAYDLNQNHSEIYIDLSFSQHNATIELTNLSAKALGKDRYTCGPKARSWMRDNCSLEKHRQVTYNFSQCTEYIKTRDSLPRWQR